MSRKSPMGFRRNPQQSEDIAKDPWGFITDCLLFLLLLLNIL